MMTIDLVSFVGGVLFTWFVFQVGIRLLLRNKSPIIKKGEELNRMGDEVLKAGMNPETWNNPEQREAYEWLRDDWQRELEKLKRKPVYEGNDDH